MNFEMLNLSEYDRHKDIVLLYVDIGNMPPKNANRHMQAVRDQVKPLFTKRGFDILFIPMRDGQPAAVVDIVSKVREQLHDQVNNYEDAMKLIGDE